MARKYTPRPTPRRPYYPARRYAQAVDQGGGFAGGWKIGEQIGGGLGQLAKAIAAAREQEARNRVANRIMNTAYAPRAGFVGGTAPAAGVPLAGTAPERGGAAAMDEAIRGQQLINALQNQKIAAQRQQTAAETMEMRRRAAMAGGGAGRSPWRPGGGASAAPVLSQGGGQAPGGKPGKPTKYEPGSSTPDDQSYYNYNNHRADVDAQHGKGTFDRLQAATGLVEQDSNTGQYISKDPDTVDVDPKTGAITLKPKGSYPGAHISSEEVQSNMARYDATSVQRGGKPSYVDRYMGSAAPQSGLGAGSQENPYTPKGTVELNAVPEGGWFVSPSDGKTYQKQPHARPAPEEKKTTGLGTETPEGTQLASAPEAAGTPVDLGQLPAGGQGTDLADAIARARAAQSLQGPTPTPMPPVDLASVAPSNMPASFSLGQLPTGGGVPDTQLADAIRMAQTADQFRGSSYG
ncbi:MAG: hypothetical protein DME55_07695 [Verrucomicrobia bacterium]|nr:MAG: hypothetical protein DME55_07695 [Verrucomicrobiota bacterium]